MLSNNTFYRFSVFITSLLVPKPATISSTNLNLQKKSLLTNLKKQITIMFVQICISQSNEKVLNNSLNIMLILYMYIQITEYYML